MLNNFFGGFNMEYTLKTEFLYSENTINVVTTHKQVASIDYKDDFTLINIDMIKDVNSFNELYGILKVKGNTHYISLAEAKFNEVPDFKDFKQLQEENL